MTRWGGIRHAPGIGQDGRLYGTLDVDCDCTDEALFRALAARLPDDAVWIVTPLRRTRATAAAIARHHPAAPQDRSEEHTSELQSLMRISYAVFCLKKNTNHKERHSTKHTRSQ